MVKDFALYMALARAGDSACVLHDYSWVAAKGREAPERDLISDVGGNKGHVLMAIVTNHPDLDLGRCVLEDAPEVLEAAKTAGDEALQKAKFVPVDFHVEQPVKGADLFQLAARTFSGLGLATME